MMDDGYAHQGGAPLIAQPVSLQGGQMLPLGIADPMASAGKDLIPQTFVCAHCQTQHVTSATGRGGSSRRKNKNGQPIPPELDKNRKPRPARPRSAVIDGQKVLLCNACGIYWQRKGQKRPLKPVKRTSARKKAKSSLAKEESVFYNAVAENFSPADADLLWCDCSQLCTSKYLMPDSGDKESLNLQECNSLIEVHKKALQLKKARVYPKDDVKAEMAMMGAGMDEEKLRGYGRGHASSKEYEAFVFQNIDIAKSKRLCAKFRKKLLSFSNDWLYKRPSLRTVQTGPNGEVTKLEGKPRVMRDKKFEHSPEELKQATCCSKLCCQKIWTNQIAQWRREYTEGNNDARWNTIQQMLLGEGYGSSKCVNVVRMITGCSRNLVASVSNYLQVNQCTGRPPPRHSMKNQPDDEMMGQHQQSMEMKAPNNPTMQQLSQTYAPQMNLMYPGNYPTMTSLGGPLLSGLVAATITMPPPMGSVGQQPQQVQYYKSQHPR